MYYEKCSKLWYTSVLTVTHCISQWRIWAHSLLPLPAVRQDLVWRYIVEYAIFFNVTKKLWWVLSKTSCKEPSRTHIPCNSNICCTHLHVQFLYLNIQIFMWINYLLITTLVMPQEPRQWKRANVVPIHKGRNKMETLNYGSVSL